MKKWQMLMIMAACFAVVGVVDSPDYYDFRSADPVVFKHEEAIIKQRVAAVEKAVEKSAVLVNYPSPTLWR